MSSLIRDARTVYLREVAARVGRKDGHLIVLTHLLEDRPELLDAMAMIAPISQVLAIDYSFLDSVHEELNDRYSIIRATQEDLRNATFLRSYLEDAANNGRVVVTEIGGYFAALLQDHSLKESLGDRVSGFVEDTEAGHRTYEDLPRPLLYPVMSVARSPLKQAEDALVGPSCVYSVETILRSLGVLLHSRRAVVLGYGKVGRGTAFCLRNMRCEVAVYDTDPIKRTLAIGEGFVVPQRQAALNRADIVFGCTGKQSVSRDDFDLLRSGVWLVSCSSKHVEFDIAGLQDEYEPEKVNDQVTNFRPKQNRDSEKTVRLIACGTPVNFLDGAVIGPALALVQAEILVAIGALFDRPPGDAMKIEHVEHNKRQELAEQWLKTFCDEDSGRYRH